MPEVIAAVPADLFDGCHNLSIWLLLPAPVLDQETVEVANSLRSHKLLFGLAILLDEKSVKQAMDPCWLEQMAECVPFCLYARKPDMNPDTAQRLRSRVVRSRTESATPLLVFDWDGDLSAINKRISGQAVVGAPVEAHLPFPFSR